jgi:hypothetical protein
VCVRVCLGAYLCMCKAYVCMCACLVAYVCVCGWVRMCVRMCVHVWFGAPHAVKRAACCPQRADCMQRLHLSAATALSPSRVPFHWRCRQRAAPGGQITGAVKKRVLRTGQKARTAYWSKSAYCALVKKRVLRTGQQPGPRAPKDHHHLTAYWSKDYHHLTAYCVLVNNSQGRVLYCVDQ